MDTIFIEHLNVSGTHGCTRDEKQYPQPFQVDVSFDVDTSAAGQTDALSDTIDYVPIRENIEQIVGGRTYNTIEKLAALIAEKILENVSIRSVSVTIRKPAIWGDVVPGVTVRKDRVGDSKTFSNKEDIIDFDGDVLIDEIIRNGGASRVLLTEEIRQKLLIGAKQYIYHPQPTIVGKMKVREELSSCYEIPVESTIGRFSTFFEKFLSEKFKNVNRELFRVSLHFNEISLQFYEKGSFGISPHMDGLSCKNLVCVVILEGKGKFALCDNREGNNPRYLDTTSGNIIFLQAPGFLNSDFRPFHFLSDITEDRIVLGLRQIIKNN